MKHFCKNCRFYEHDHMGRDRITIYYGRVIETTEHHFCKKNILTIEANYVTGIEEKTINDFCINHNRDGNCKDFEEKRGE